MLFAASLPCCTRAANAPPWRMLPPVLSVRDSAGLRTVDALQRIAECTPCCEALLYSGASERRDWQGTAKKPGLHVCARSKGFPSTRASPVPGACGSEAVAAQAAHTDPARPSLPCLRATPDHRNPMRRLKSFATPMDHPSRNVYTCPVSLGAIEAARRVVEGLRPGNKPKTLAFRKKKLVFHVEQPTWKSDIKWISAHDPASLSFFQGIYGRLGLADAFTHIGKMVMLSGYFVTRCTTLKSHFHTDFDCTGGRAFTFMAPLFDMSGMKDGHLLCETGNESKGIARYRYQLGRAIVFGDGFVHATETGTAPREIAFLCFTFGDHKMKLGEWRKAEYYISRQCPFYKDLAGNVLRSAEISGSF
mmetsp:Transcript_26856/g.52179  ORF Transcript_26856/g.52179 Transcript_26856/m.52179 type:complete len:362 (-) Transcript_26856:373-1458(-)